MAASTTAIDTKKLVSEDYSPVPVAAATKIPAGCLVALNAAGDAINAADVAGARVIGIALATADNSAGIAAAISVSVQNGPVSGLINEATSLCTKVHIGKTVYVKDNQTVQSGTGTNSITAGYLMGFNDDGTLRINIAPTKI